MDFKKFKGWPFHQEHSLSSLPFDKNHVAVMAHELRTPLAVIRGQIEILRHLLLSKSQIDLQQAEKAVATMDSSVLFLLRQLDMFLTFFSSADKDFESKSSVVEMNEFFLNLEKLANLSTKNKKSHIFFYLDLSIPKVLHLHDSALSNVIINLTDNASKFSDMTPVEVRASYLPGHLTIQVKDYGIGIAKKEKTKIFDAFYQVETQDNRRFGGSGLGLAIVKRLLDIIGGTVEVQSELGRGSTFTVTVPAEPASLPSFSEKTCLNTTRPYVLVVEDDNDLLSLVKFFLGKLDIEIETARNGKEAIEKIMERRKRKEDVSLVFMDLQMPIVDGMSATKFLRKRGMSMPIIAVTAHLQKYKSEQCLKAGFNQFLMKPYNADILQQAVKKYCHLESKTVH